MARLIAYYSRGGENYFGGAYRYVTKGNTQVIAEDIAAKTGAEMFQIEQQVPYAADYQTCIAEAKRDLQANARPALKALPDSLDQYDEIYLGYPIYWGDMPMAVYTFLESFDWNGNTIRPFCTHEGSGLGRTESKLKQAAPGAVIAPGLAVLGSSVGSAEGAVNGWL